MNWSTFWGRVQSVLALFDQVTSDKLGGQATSGRIAAQLDAISYEAHTVSWECLKLILASGKGAKLSENIKDIIAVGWPSGPPALVSADVERFVDESANQQ